MKEHTVRIYSPTHKGGWYRLTAYYNIAPGQRSLGTSLGYTLTKRGAIRRANRYVQKQKGIGWSQENYLEIK